MLAKLIATNPERKPIQNNSPNIIEEKWISRRQLMVKGDNNEFWVTPSLPKKTPPKELKP